MKTITNFESLGLSQSTLDAISKRGFEEPTSIQKKCIPLLLKGKSDLIGKAQTGTGKTAAFGLPVIEKVKPELNKIQALIIAPTRELSMQITEDMNSFKGEKKLKIISIYGGQSIEIQLRKLKEGVHIVVGTPGRIIDLIDRKRLDLSNVKILILDEADEMLNMGFIEDIENILSYTPSNKRMLFFSATMPSRILKLAKEFMTSFEFVEIENVSSTTNLTDHIYYEVNEHDKFELLSRIIDMDQEFYGLIFCKTRNDVDELTNKLVQKGYLVEGMHGEVTQNQRERIFNQFRKKQINILVATDVAARGIDINNMTHVVNYSLPHDNENYIHRIGRTGRAGNKGTAITLIKPSEYRKFKLLMSEVNIVIKKEKHPDISQVIKAKKDRILNKLQSLMKNSQQDIYTKFVSEILEENDPKELLAALIKYSFHKELDETSYNKIEDVSNKIAKSKSSNSKSKHHDDNERLFVAKGRRDGMTKRSLVDFISKKSSIKSSTINNIDIYEEFSFVTVNLAAAEIIIAAFKKMKNNGKSVITKAKNKK